MQLGTSATDHRDILRGREGLGERPFLAGASARWDGCPETLSATNITVDIFRENYEGIVGDVSPGNPARSRMENFLVTFVSSRSR